MHAAALLFVLAHSQPGTTATTGTQSALPTPPSPPPASQAAPPAAPAQQPRLDPCGAPVHRQFDFWLGNWDVVNVQGGFAGTNRIEAVDGGCALYESWSSGSGGYTGRSLNSVGADGRWRQTWVDSSGLRLEIAGGLVGESMVLEGETPPGRPGGPPVKNRITWSPQPEGRVRQHWETSADAGKTWTTAFDGTYHPVERVRSAARTGSAEAEGDGAAGKAAELLRALEGGWIGSGAVLERDAHVELTVTRVLGGKFVRLEWRNLGGRDGRHLFEGLAIYEERADGTLAATWWDSQGARHAVSATVEGKQLTALWGERGRTVYRMLGSGELEVTDSVKGKDGAFAEFGRTTLKRKTRPAAAAAPPAP